MATRAPPEPPSSLATMMTALGLGLLGACTQLDVGLLPGGDASSADPGPGTTADPPTVGSTASIAASSGSVDSTSADATTGTTTATSTTAEGTTGEGLEQSPCDSEQEVCAQVQLDGAPAGFCGETLELKGITQPAGDGRWLVEDCGSCELCGGPTYELEIIAPMDWVPTDLPLCSRITIDFAPLDSTPWACGFLGVAVFGDDGLGEDPAPVYMAASITAAPPSAVMGLEVGRDNVDPKPCEDTSCCFENPGDYTITWSGAGLTQPLTLAEGEQASDVAAFGVAYDALNERSHAHEQCDKIPHFDWIFRR